MRRPQTAPVIDGVDAPGARRWIGWVSGVPPQAVAGAVAEVHGSAGALCGGDGSLRQCASLGPGNRRLGHKARLVPPAYVKPFVKWQKNDMADAEAICEAAQRPTMRSELETSRRRTDDGGYGATVGETGSRKTRANHRAARARSG